MKTFKEYIVENDQELQEVMGQFKDASKKAMELAQKLGKMITIMQHTKEGDYGKAMKVVGATLAARLAARGMIKRSSGEKKKGKLGKK